MNNNNRQTKIKIGICAMAILMMGVVGVSSSLSVIGAHFADASQNTIQSLISIPCLVILPATLISGKLMDFMPKKILGMIGKSDTEFTITWPGVPSRMRNKGRKNQMASGMFFFFGDKLEPLQIQ